MSSDRDTPQDPDADDIHASELPATGAAVPAAETPAAGAPSPRAPAVEDPAPPAAGLATGDAAGRHRVPAIDPRGPLDPGLRLSEAEQVRRTRTPAPPPSRRLVLGTAAVALLAAGGGVGYAFWRTRRRHPSPSAPAGLLAASRAEHALVAEFDAALAAGAAPPALLRTLRRDHAQHAAAIDAAIAERTGSPPFSSASSAPATATTRADLLDLERAATSAATRRALTLSGRDATLLASIAACEATHVELLR